MTRLHHDRAAFLDAVVVEMDKKIENNKRLMDDSALRVRRHRRKFIIVSAVSGVALGILLLMLLLDIIEANS